MDLVKRIDKYLKSVVDEPRKYIGASSIGHACERAIWYGCNEPDKKIVEPQQRLTYKIGHYLETMLLGLMTDSGLKYYVNTEFHCEEFPLFQGHVDAFVKGEGIIEIKTAKDSSFNIFKKKGLRLWYPEYYDQVQSYMGMSKLHTCYMLVLNKDTSELCQQVIDFDEERYSYLVAKAKRINEYSVPPKRIND